MARSVLRAHPWAATQYSGLWRTGAFLFASLLKSSRGTLPRSFALLSHARLSCADWKKTHSIQDVGSGAGTRSTYSVTSTSPGNRSSLMPPRPIAATWPDSSVSRIWTMTGLRCPASCVEDSIAAAGGLVDEQRDPAWEALQGIPIVLLPEPGGRHHQTGREHVHQVEVIGHQESPLGRWHLRLGVGIDLQRQLVCFAHLQLLAPQHFLVRGQNTFDVVATAPLHEHEHPLLGPRDHDVEQALGYVRIFPPVVVVVDVRKHDRVEL